MSDRRAQRLLATLLVALGLGGTLVALALPFGHSGVFPLSVAAGIVALVLLRPAPERPSR